MYAKDYLQKNANGATKSEVVRELTTGTFVGGAIGAGVGLFLAYKQQKSYLLYSFVGLLVGGIITRAFINPSTEKTEKNG
jgi:gas vesicle protein